jgi:phage shock protein A
MTMEQRLTHIEEQIAFLSRQVDQLDEVVRGLGGQVQTLKQEMADLRRWRDALEADADAEDSDPSHNAPL